MSAIKQYANNVFTNDGQTDVPGILPKLVAAKTALNAVAGLKVYVGYHGNEIGRFFQLFDDAEMDQVREMQALMFPHSILMPLSQEISADAIRVAVDEGNVFFTWCDSNTYVTSLMGESMPASVASYAPQS